MSFNDDWDDPVGGYRQRPIHSWDRHKAEEENRQHGAVPKDWNNQQDVRRFVNFHLQDFSGQTQLATHLREFFNRGQITTTSALMLLHEIPRQEERLFKKCVSELAMHIIYSGVPMHEEYVAVMNDYRVYAAMDRSQFIYLRNAVLENSDLRKLGVSWALVGNHLDDALLRERFLATAVTTHALECIQDLGDATADTSDAILFERLEKGIGPDPQSSEKTAEFLSACQLLGTNTLKPEEKVELASQMIVMLVGRQSKRDKGTAGDSSVRTQYTKLRTLNYLLNVIFSQMTPDNAGVMLRWAMGRHRHHEWVWKRITTEVEKVHHWRLAKVERFENGDVGVAWWLRGRQTVVLPTSGSTELYGDLEPAQTLVIVPPSKQLGALINRGDNWTLYQAPLHPLRPPTPQMREAIK